MFENFVFKENHLFRVFRSSCQDGLAKQRSTPMQIKQRVRSSSPRKHANTIHKFDCSAQSGIKAALIQRTRAKLISDERRAEEHQVALRSRKRSNTCMKWLVGAGATPTPQLDLENKQQRVSNSVDKFDWHGGGGIDAVSWPVLG